MYLKNKKKFDRATVLYKAFLIILFTGNGYPMFTGGLTIVDYVYHVILCVYIIFRYYMLIRIKNVAVSFDLTLTEYLIERNSKVKCKGCPNVDDCDKCL
jgi:hypothetical protein